MQATICCNTMRRGLSAADLTSLNINSSKTCTFKNRADIRTVGSKHYCMHVLIAGWACKYKFMSDGRRQIISFRLPGDVCDLEQLYDADADFGATALTDCTVATVAVRWLEQARGSVPAVRDMLWSLMSREHAAMTEQIIALGRRTARQRTAYLLYDLFERLQALGLVDKGCFHMPATQADMADALGLSVVHVNRTLQSLREDGLITMQGRAVCVPRPAALARAASLEPRERAVASALPPIGDALQLAGSGAI